MWLTVIALLPPLRVFTSGAGGTLQRDDRAQDLVPANPMGAVPAQLGPQLRHVDLHLVNDLVGELLGLKDPHARFREVEDNQVLQADNCFGRYEMRSLYTIKMDIREARRYFPDDLRKIEHLGFPQVAFVIELFDHIPVNPQSETAEF